ncbi:bestrophin-like domain [Microbulbifer hainanensis]|uniref:bestrophin-like domain n=1 Tax=Microbulbifer hainanensis TaxID=2735675 RepID=UPI001866DFF2|nr:hypothetical protein [Microbulbifer hainanensis]
MIDFVHTAGNLFHIVSLPFVYIGTVLVVLASLMVGIAIGRRHRQQNREAKDSSVGSAVAASLGLLAFLLAFTFNLTANRFNQRKALLLDEVNAIHTTYLRASFLEAQAQPRARKLLREYVELRDIDPVKDKVTDEDLARSEAIHEALWALVDEHLQHRYSPGYLRQFVEPLNTVINFHYSRVIVGLEYRIPGPIWLALYFMTILAMLMIGFQFGISRGRSLKVALALALTFATVIVLIADMDRALEGLLTIDQRPMAELNKLLKSSQQ